MATAIILSRRQNEAISKVCEKENYKFEDRQLLIGIVNQLNNLKLNNRSRNYSKKMCEESILENVQESKQAQARQITNSALDIVYGKEA